MPKIERKNLERQYKVLGIVDDVNECGCCGRINLKATVAMESYTSGEVHYFGSHCALLMKLISVEEEKEFKKKIARIAPYWQKVMREAHSYTFQRIIIGNGYRIKDHATLTELHKKGISYAKESLSDYRRMLHEFEREHKMKLTVFED